MAEVEEDIKSNSPPFVEVICKVSGRTRRFSLGTEAGFAVNLMNKKLEREGVLGVGNPFASHIEAVKEGEEPVSFGPNSILVDYGPGWRLETVVDVAAEGIAKRANVGKTTEHITDSKVTDDSQSTKKTSQSAISFSYIGRILLAFCFYFYLWCNFHFDSGKPTRSNSFQGEEGVIK